MVANIDLWLMYRSTKTCLQLLFVATITFTGVDASLVAKTKTYNSGYSLMVTHLTTNPPVRCLNRAERTGSLVFNVLWSYVDRWHLATFYIKNR